MNLFCFFSSHRLCASPNFRATGLRVGADRADAVSSAEFSRSSQFTFSSALGLVVCSYFVFFSFAGLFAGAAAFRAGLFFGAALPAAALYDCTMW